MKFAFNSLVLVSLSIVVQSCNKSKDETIPDAIGCRSLSSTSISEGDFPTEIQISFDESVLAISGTYDNVSNTHSVKWKRKFSDKSDAILEVDHGIWFSEMNQTTSAFGTTPAIALGFSSKSLNAVVSNEDSRPVSIAVEYEVYYLSRTTPNCSPFDAGCLSSTLEKWSESVKFTEWDDKGRPKAGESQYYKNDTLEGTSSFTLAVDEVSRTATLLESICSPSCSETKTKVTFDVNGNFLSGSIEGSRKPTGNVLAYRFPEVNVPEVTNKTWQVTQASNICPQP